MVVNAVDARLRERTTDVLTVPAVARAATHGDRQDVRQWRVRAMIDEMEHHSVSATSAAVSTAGIAHSTVHEFWHQPNCQSFTADVALLLVTSRLSHHIHQTEAIGLTRNA